MNDCSDPLLPTPAPSPACAHVLLTLIAPAAAADRIADRLLKFPELEDGFTSGAASAHGPGVRFDTARERVQGKSHCVRFDAVVEARALPRLLARLRASAAAVGVAYRICPLLECGTLDPVETGVRS